MWCVRRILIRKYLIHSQILCDGTKIYVTVIPRIELIITFFFYYYYLVREK